MTKYCTMTECLINENWGFKPNRCTNNALLTARHTGDLVVEGLLITKVGGRDLSMEPHAWNRTPQGDYYDVMQKFVFNTPDFQEKLRQASNGTVEAKDVTFEYVAFDEFSQESYADLADEETIPFISAELIRWKQKHQR